MKNRKTRSAMRRMLFTLALVLVVAVASVGGTIAWLTDKTDPVTNTFTVGDINIDLYETKYPNGTDKANGGHHTSTEWNAKLIPGNEYSKNPVVKVLEGSESCWLFVEVNEPTGLNGVLTYELNFDDTWTKGDGNSIPANVRYKKVDAGFELNLLKNDKVSVANTVTKDMIKNLSGSYTMTFKAYAVQYEKFEGKAADAWNQVKPSSATGA